MAVWVDGAGVTRLWGASPSIELTRKRMLKQVLDASFFARYSQGFRDKPPTRWERIVARWKTWKQRIGYAKRALRGDWPDYD